MPDNALVAFERQLAPLAPRFDEALSGIMKPERLIRTIVISCERLPKLLDCDRQSLFNSAMSAACLGLEVDGVTGQAYLIPFKGRAQLVIGYKGYNTLAARSGLTITGQVVREGDEFDFELGDKAYIRHKPKLGAPGRKVLAAWAVASANNRPPVVQVLGIDELLAVKAKSPGARMSDSPWNDAAIGFPAMCEKTAKRRLARSMPLNVMQLAARLDEAVQEQDRAAYITPERGLVIEGEVMEPSPTPTADYLLSPRANPGHLSNAVNASPAADSVSDPAAGGAPSAAEYCERWRGIKDAATDAKQLSDSWNADKALRNKIEWRDDEQRIDLQNEVTAAVQFLKKA